MNLSTVSTKETTTHNIATMLFLTSSNRDGPSVMKLCVPPQAECISTNEYISLVSNSVYPSNLVHDIVRYRLHCTRYDCYNDKDIILHKLLGNDQSYSPVKAAVSAMVE